MGNPPPTTGSGPPGGAGLHQLETALRAQARGLYCDEAGVQLLIGHRSWLCRRDFTCAFVETGVGLTSGVDMASIDWSAAVTAVHAGYLPCSSSEGQMLRIAASLSGGIPVDLGNAITGLDQTNLGLVLRAVWHAGGHRPAGL